MRAWQALGIAAAFAAALTLVVSLTPAVRFAYYAPELHVALDTAEALIAALAAFLLHGRFRKSGRLDDLALVVALALLAIANLGLSSLPRVFLSADDARIALSAGGLHGLGLRGGNAGGSPAPSAASTARHRSGDRSLATVVMPRLVADAAPPGSPRPGSGGCAYAADPSRARDRPSGLTRPTVASVHRRRHHRGRAERDSRPCARWSRPGWAIDVITDSHRGWT